MTNPGTAALDLGSSSMEDIFAPSATDVVRNHAPLTSWSLPVTHPLQVKQAKPLIVRSVDFAIRSVFPKKYFGLCHVYAIVGASLAYTVLGREYRPIAGLAVIDAGAGCKLKLLDNQAFARNEGGAYHCWIESIEGNDEDREFIDLAFQHNALYAKQHRQIWRKKSSHYLWGLRRNIVIDADLDALPTKFPDDMLWVQETPEGTQWLDRQLADHMDEYVKLTSFALKRFYSFMPTGT